MREIGRSLAIGSALALVPVAGSWGLLSSRETDLIWIAKDVLE